VQSRQSVADLVAFISRDRPFLSERVVPLLAVPEASEARNVLHNTEILVVGFLHQETVVLDSWLGSGDWVWPQAVQAE
jgi:hypothetical protein